MANRVLKAVALKLDYDLGMAGGKKVIKSKTIASINHTVADDDLYAFAEALFKVQSHAATINKVETATISN